MKFKVAAVALCIIVSGCQTAPQGPLPTNEFTFNADKAKTKDAIISSFLPNGYQLVRDSEFQLVLDKPATDNFGAQMIYGSQWNGVPNARVTMTLTGNNPTKVTTQLAVITNPGTGFERPNDVNQNHDARAAMVSRMQQAQAKLAAK
ncbi:MAG: hypothetical protein DI546_09425 [Rhizobium sp.]|nr:MAG: hypothetical protein DI546_09425 [Rhizobium sp.]